MGTAVISLLKSLYVSTLVLVVVVVVAVVVSVLKMRHQKVGCLSSSNCFCLHKNEASGIVASLYLRSTRQEGRPASERRVVAVGAHSASVAGRRLGWLCRRPGHPLTLGNG